MSNCYLIMIGKDIIPPVPLVVTSAAGMHIDSWNVFMSVI